MGRGRELLARRKDGTELPVEVMLGPVETDDGLLVKAAIRDISDQKAAELALARAKDAAVALSRELDAFSYSVAHELRAPVRAIDGLTALLAERLGPGLDPEPRVLIGEIRASSQHMRALIEGLLDLARLSRREVKREPVDLGGLFATVLAELARQDPSRAVEVTIAPGLVARLDPVLARTLAENLAGNAWKFTGGTAHARIEVGVAEADGRRAFFVRDNGAGFDMAFASRLFGPFQRLHDESEFHGTGVGLSTVQRIVHLHGGALWATGELGRGASFHFTVPEGIDG
jgi:signal transduction histidine kinase